MYFMRILTRHDTTCAQTYLVFYKLCSLPRVGTNNVCFHHLKELYAESSLLDFGKTDFAQVVASDIERRK